jgi:hypothetical protein
MSLARGKYISLLQHDDVLAPGMLSEAARVLDLHEDVGLLLFGSDDIDSKGQFISARPTKMAAGIIAEPLNEILTSDCMVFLPSATVVRRSAVEQSMKPWPDLATADFSMYVDLAVAGWKYVYAPDFRIGYRVHGQQLSANSLPFRDSLVRFWGATKFEDPRWELRRLRLLTRAFIARAGGHLRAGRSTQVREDLLSARKLQPAIAREPRWNAMLALSFVPDAVPLALNVWERVRNPMKNRYKGF